MTNPTIVWHNHDSRGLVCEVVGEVSNDQFEQIRQLFAEHVNSQLGGGIEVDSRARRLIITRVSPWLEHPSSIFRQWFTNQLELCLSSNGQKIRR